ncbi:DUF6624 domain-containing protein [Streptomyces sp. NPDC048638]|uniref:DUF6624 domain-containing protein n=1 Tax=Streptomyces sp. NPDC048638 TaxID=3365580 RepID=UPI00371F764F
MMTTPAPSGPSRPDIARVLLARAESARPDWRTPAVRLAAMTPDELAALHDSAKVNAQALRHIVGKYRWPGRSLVGEEACQAALGIALRADHDPPFQTTLARMLLDAARRGEATPAQWAHLHDRCLVNAGQAQQYGTQYWYRPDGRLDLHPVADPATLDARRGHVGLPPHAQAAERLRHHHRDPASLSRHAAAAQASARGRPAA